MRTTPFADALRTAVVIFAVLTATSSASAQTRDGDETLPGRAIPVAQRATQPPTLPMWDTAARQTLAVYQEAIAC